MSDTTNNSAARGTLQSAGRRLPAVVILVGLLVAALIYDNEQRAPAPADTERTVGLDDFPIASDPADLSSTWFCAGGTSDDNAFATHTVHILNPGLEPVRVQVTAFGGSLAPPPTSFDDPDAPPEGDGSGAADAGDDDAGASATDTPVDRTVEVPANGSVSVTLREMIVAPIASALVEAEVGGIVVEHQVRSIHGRDIKPCASGASDTWHFAFGATTVDARELLVLFNPYPDDVVVDGVFSTETGVRTPGRWEGLVVPGYGTIGVDLGDDVTRREQVAATITTRSGRLVVDRVQRFRGDAGRPRGLTVQLGVPKPQLDWVFPDGFVSDRIAEHFVVYNPTETTAAVEIEIILDDPDTNGIPAPFEITVLPGRHEVVDVGADGRVPNGIGHAAIARSENGTPFVVERVSFSSGNQRRGVAVTTGSPVLAEEWFFAAGSTSGLDEWLILTNLDAELIATIDVGALVGGQRLAVSGLQGFEIPPGARVALQLGRSISRAALPIVVTATEPIVAERGLYVDGADSLGTSNAIGIPSSLGLVLPGDPLAVELDGLDLGDDVTDDDIPVAPDDVDLPDADEVIDIDDPDADADVPPGEETTTTAAPEEPVGEDDPPPEESTTTTTETTGVPATTPES